MIRNDQHEMQLKDNQLFIRFLGLKEHEVHSNTYMLWAPLNPVMDWDEIYEQSTLKFVDWCHINSFRFHNDWNWLMYTVQEIRKRIIVPMDQDWNHFYHDQYQRLRGYLLAKQEEANQEKLYDAVVEMMQWWVMYDEYRKRQTAKV